MVSISDELKEGNILKLILIVRFSCATLDVGHPMAPLPFGMNSLPALISDTQKPDVGRGRWGRSWMGQPGEAVCLSFMIS
jgi:hypothetical protein